MINRVELKNFGPIEELDWQNLGKINLVIGNNGCGKSFLLKALYSTIKTIEEYKRGNNNKTESEILVDKLYWNFQTAKIGNLVSINTDSELSLNLIFNEKLFSYQFNKNTTKEISNLENHVEPRTDNSIYLPAKEVLSLFHIILESREEDKLFGFDDTYMDLVKALLRLRKTPKQWNKEFEELFFQLLEKQPEVLSKDLIKSRIINSPEIQEHKDTLHDNSKIILPEKTAMIFQKCQKKLEDIVRGKFEFNEQINAWEFRQNKQNFSIGIMAEGIKKIGLLDTLLSNGYLTEDSIIFIDEIEANLHPTAISNLLDIIGILAKDCGIQFFIASHSYFVIQKLFLIAQKESMSIPVLSYQNNEWVQSNLKEEMPSNPIIQESVRLYKEEMFLASQ